MYVVAGRIVEEGGVVPVLKQPRMPYTQGLLASVPRLAVCGATYDGTGVAACLASARRAVEELLATR